MASALHEPEDVEVQARLEWLRTQAVADPLPDFPHEDGNHLSLGFLDERQWVAVPMESAAYFDEEILGYVLKAFERVGDDRALAVQAENLGNPIGPSGEPLDGDPRYVEFRATPESLQEFSSRFSFFSYLLVPFSMEFAILCTHEVFMLWAGPERLLRHALGDIAEARKVFDEYAAGFIEYADEHAADHVEWAADRNALTAGEKEVEFRRHSRYVAEEGEWLQRVAERYRRAVKMFLDESGPAHHTRHHSIQYRQGGLEEADREFDRLTGGQGWTTTATEDPLFGAGLTAGALHEPEDDEVRTRLEWLRTQAVADTDILGDEGNDLSLDFLKERQWVAVPMESATFFDEETLGYALKAFEHIGDDRVLAVQAENLEGLPKYLEFRATPESLQEFSNRFGSFSYLLVPFSMEFAILCTHEVFTLWAGPERLLQDVLGDVAEARKVFDEFAASFIEFAADHNIKGAAREGEWLQSVAERYR